MRRWKILVQRRLTKEFGRLHRVAPSLISKIYNHMYTRSTTRKNKGICIIATISPVPVRWLGKMRSRTFLKPFCIEVSRLGYFVRFANSVAEIERYLEDEKITILLNVIGEDVFTISSRALEHLEKKPSVTFNSLRVGLIIADKLKTQQTLTSHGVLMPRILDGASGGFLRARSGTNLPTKFLAERPEGAAIDDKKAIVNEFIDTTVDWENENFYTSVRLLCINDKIIHKYVRARSCRDQDPSVHASDTPLNSDFLNYLQDTVINPNIDCFAEIAKKIYDALGDGFYAHDILVERSSGRLLVCETGYKFDDYSFWMRIRSIKKALDIHSIFFPPEEFAKKSAAIFVAEVERRLASEPL